MTLPVDALRKDVPIAREDGGRGPARTSAQQSAEIAGPVVIHGVEEMVGGGRPMTLPVDALRKDVPIAREDGGRGRARASAQQPAEIAGPVVVHGVAIVVGGGRPVTLPVDAGKAVGPCRTCGAVVSGYAGGTRGSRWTSRARRSRRSRDSGGTRRASWPGRSCGAGGTRRTRWTCRSRFSSDASWARWPGRPKRSRWTSGSCRTCGSGRACRTSGTRRAARSRGSRYTRRSGRAGDAGWTCRACRTDRSSWTCGPRRTCGSRRAGGSGGTCMASRSRGSRYTRGSGRTGDASWTRRACGTERSCRTRGSRGTCRTCRPRRTRGARAAGRPGRARQSGRTCWSRRSKRAGRARGACRSRGPRRSGRTSWPRWTRGSCASRRPGRTGDSCGSRGSSRSKGTCRPGWSRGSCRSRGSCVTCGSGRAGETRGSRWTGRPERSCRSGWSGRPRGTSRSRWTGWTRRSGWSCGAGGTRRSRGSRRASRTRGSCGTRRACWSRGACRPCRSGGASGSRRSGDSFERENVPVGSIRCRIAVGRRATADVLAEIARPVELHRVAVVVVDCRVRSSPVDADRSRRSRGSGGSGNALNSLEALRSLNSLISLAALVSHGSLRSRGPGGSCGSVAEAALEEHLEAGRIVAFVGELRARKNHAAVGRRARERRSGARDDGSHETRVRRRDGGNDVGDVRLKVFEPAERIVLRADRVAEGIENAHAESRRVARRLHHREVVTEVFVAALIDTLDRRRFARLNRKDGGNAGEEQPGARAEIFSRREVENSRRNEDLAARGDDVPRSQSGVQAELRQHDVFVHFRFAGGERVGKRRGTGIGLSGGEEEKSEAHRLSRREIRDPDRRVELRSVGARHAADRSQVEVARSKPGEGGGRRQQQSSECYQQSLTAPEFHRAPFGRVSNFLCEGCRRERYRSKKRGVKRLPSIISGPGPESPHWN